MNKIFKYIIGIIAILVVIFFSLDIQSLDDYKATSTNSNFNAEAYTNDIWQNKLPLALNEAVEIDVLTSLLNSNPKKAFDQFGKKLGISKTYYFLVKGKGTIVYSAEEYIKLKLDSEAMVQLATDFIFGNAVREGIGVVNISDFVNMTDFNNVSVMLNKKVKSEIIPQVIANANPETKVSFTGVVEINEKNIALNTIRIIPVAIQTESSQ